MKKLRYLGIGMVLLSLLVFSGMWLAYFSVQAQLDEYQFQRKLQYERPDSYHGSPAANDYLVTVNQLFDSLSPILLGLGGIGVLLIVIPLVAHRPTRQKAAKPASKIPQPRKPLANRATRSIALVMTVLGLVLLFSSLGWYSTMVVRISLARQRDAQILHHREYPVGGGLRAPYVQLPAGDSYMELEEKLAERYGPFAFAATLGGAAFLAVGLLIGCTLVLRGKRERTGDYHQPD